MILVNTDYIAGKELEMLGLVKGSTIQSVNMGKDIGQAFKSLVGGELKSYNEMMNNARALATKRMVEEAEALGADAIVNVRYSSASIMQSAAEVMAYGTAVKFKLFDKHRISAKLLILIRGGELIERKRKSEETSSPAHLRGLVERFAAVGGG